MEYLEWEKLALCLLSQVQRLKWLLLQLRSNRPHFYSKIIIFTQNTKTDTIFNGGIAHTILSPKILTAQWNVLKFCTHVANWTWSVYTNLYNYWKQIVVSMLSEASCRHVIWGGGAPPWFNEKINFCTIHLLVQLQSSTKSTNQLKCCTNVE